MNTYISLLRGINVSGQKKIKMADLRALYEGLGFENVKSYLQSGNMVFTSAETDLDVLSAKIGAAIEAAYGFEVPILMRTAADLQRILATAPYADADIKLQYFTLFNSTPDAEKLAALQAPDNIPDEFTLGQDEVFVHVPGGYGRTKLNNNWFERKLKIQCTTRNWKTMTALVEMTT